MYTLSNGLLEVVISEKGAELQSLKNIADGTEFLWQGNPDFWGKRSPVLFPIVGGLKDAKYKYGGKEYVLGRHGFARDKVFELIDISPNTALLEIRSTPETLGIYPFEFRFQIAYHLEGNTLSTEYHVFNEDKKEMYFNVGAHPAFNVPLHVEDQLEEYVIEWEAEEHVGIQPISPTSGLIQTFPIPFMKGNKLFPINKELFYNDALIFLHLRSRKVSLHNTQNTHGVLMNFKDFPFFGIWSAKNANFVCLEPWTGIGDLENCSGNIEDKFGINVLSPGLTASFKWEITVF